MPTLLFRLFVQSAQIQQFRLNMTTPTDPTATFRDTMRIIPDLPPSGRFADSDDKTAAYSALKKALIQWCLSRPNHDDPRGLLAYNVFLSAAAYAEIFGQELPLPYPFPALPDFAANATNAAVFLRQREETQRKLVLADVSAIKSIIVDQAGPILDPLRNSLTGLGLVPPAQLWTHLDTQYGLASITSTDIARWYASTEVPFDRTKLLSENLFADVAKHNRVTELLGPAHSPLPMQRLLQLTSKATNYHLTAASWVDDYNQQTPVLNRTYQALSEYLLQAETRHNGSLLTTHKAAHVVAAPAEAPAEALAASTPAPLAAAKPTHQRTLHPQRCSYCFLCGYGRNAGWQCYTMNKYGILQAPYTSAMLKAHSPFGPDNKLLTLVGSDGVSIKASEKHDRRFTKD